jgi:AcrR family transcriptional regulator
MQPVDTVHRKKMSVTRDKEAKISSILDATRALIEVTAYDAVTIRDIAASAGVSVGLIYKYFPGGKFDIIKYISSQHFVEQFVRKQPETIDFSDFPGYMRALIKDVQQASNDNSSLMKALMVVAARDSEMVDDIEKLDFYNAIPELFDRFQGVDLGDKNPLELLVNWTIMAKGIIHYSMLFRGSLNEEDALTDLMTDLSLHIWGYRKKR